MKKFLLTTALIVMSMSTTAFAADAANSLNNKTIFNNGIIKVQGAYNNSCNIIKPTEVTTKNCFEYTTQIVIKPICTTTESTTHTVTKPTYTTTEATTQAAVKPTVTTTEATTQAAVKPTVTTTEATTQAAVKPTVTTTEATTQAAVKPTVTTTEATTQAAVKPTVTTTEATTQAAVKPTVTTTEATTETTTQAAVKPTVTTTEATTETTTQAAVKPTVTTTEATTETTTQKVTVTETSTETTTSAANNSMARQLLTLVNKARAENGLSALTLNDSLSNVAQKKADDMKNNNYFSHTSPTYGSPFDMIKNAGISYKTAGENIAKGQKTAEAVFNAWMNSSGHRANILNSRFTQMGVGVTSGTTYWSQMFIG